eukprot:CAMPEP_0182879740 /NCGR_PEP_ID=MMETSP0034_2-20130328/16159_1 /TAXON_ID=156128 /ORGANISM="Nephroselmis pyriformis, Strain CCMP717" /LENGTH=46 /DNA_ID= /DNA_START= /DNA_END= /DNA_ORIENTATION=
MTPAGSISVGNRFFAGATGRSKSLGLSQISAAPKSAAGPGTALEAT